MDYKQEFLSLIIRFKEHIESHEEYIRCNKLLKKIDEVSKDCSKIGLFDETDISLFTYDNSKEIIVDIRNWASLFGHDLLNSEEFLEYIEILKNDIFDNKLMKYNQIIKKIEYLYNNIDNIVTEKNYELLFSFIEECSDYKIIDTRESVLFNLYVCKWFSDINVELTQATDIVTIDEADEFETIDIEEFDEDNEIELRKIFEKYDYDYDCLDDEMKTKFNKYVKCEYLDFILSNFKKYGILSSDIKGYSKTLFRISIDNDRGALQSIFEFIDKNNCSLHYLLGIPSIFSRRKKKYIPKLSSSVQDEDINYVDDVDFEIIGSFDYFFKNIELYKKLSKKEIISDDDLYRTSKFLSTPSSLVEKNLSLLRKYKIVGADEFPVSFKSLCGVHTEYLIDRYIEADLYDSYLSMNNGKSKGSSYLSGTNRAFKFYKIKLANDMGQPIFAFNGGIRGVFNNDNENYYGLSLRTNGNMETIMQKSISFEELEQVDPKIRKKLAPRFYWHDNGTKYNKQEIANIEFRNLYQYRNYSPSDIFPSVNENQFEIDVLNKVFANDFKNVNVDSSIEKDKIVEILDNAVCTDKNGTYHQLKTSDFKYEFINSAYPNIRVVISRQKVLRLLNQLRQIDFLSDNLSRETIINILLSILLKDSIVSEYEKVMVRFTLNLIFEKKLEHIDKAERGIRRC